MDLLFILTVVTVSLFSVYIWIQVPFFGNRKPLPPLAFSLPLVGSPCLLTSDPQKGIQKLWRRYGPVFRIHRGCDVVVVLSGAKVIKEAIKLYPWNLGSAKIRPNITASLFVKGGHLSEGKRWARQRAILSSSTRRLSNDPEEVLQLILMQECGNLLKGMMPYCREISNHRRKTTDYFPVDALARVIARTMYRIAYGAGDAIDEGTSQLLEEIAQNIGHYSRHSGPLSPLDRFPWWSRIPKILGSDNMAFQHVASLLKRVCSGAVQRRERELRTRDDDVNNPDLMAYFYRTSAHLSDKDRETGLTPSVLFEGLGDVLRAGTDTATALMSWAVQYLALYPDAQETIAEQVRNFAVMNNCPGDVMVVTAKESPPKCVSFFLETMRVVSLTPYSCYLRRRPLKDIDICGYTIPKGTPVILNADSANIDPTVFPDPESFLLPWRFMTGECSIDTQLLNQHFPFGIGKRRCPGEDLGLQVALTQLATLIHNFVFIQDPVFPLPAMTVFGINNNPSPFKLILKRRHLSSESKTKLLASSIL